MTVLRGEGVILPRRNGKICALFVDGKTVELWHNDNKYFVTPFVPHFSMSLTMPQMVSQQGLLYDVSTPDRLQV